MAEALVELYGEQSATVASDLARLFGAGRKFLRAGEYYLAAAKNASRIFAASESAALARQGLAAIQSAAPTAERNAIELSLHLTLGNALLIALGYGAPEVKELYERAHDFCRRVGEPAQVLPILYGLWISHLIRGEIEQALGFGEEFLNLAQQVQSPGRIVGERMVGCPLFYFGDLTRARPYFERAISIYDPAQHRPLAWVYGQEPGMTARSYLAWTMWLLGYPDQAAEHDRESLKLAREVEHALSLGHALYFAAIHAHLRRDWEAVRVLSDELVLLGRERKLAFWLPAGRVLNGLMISRDGDALTGIEEMRCGIEALSAVNTALCLTSVYLFLADGCAYAGRTEEALTAIQAALDLAQRTGECFFEPELHRFQGELLLRQGSSGCERKAEACFQQALKIARQQNAKSWELRACTSLSRFWAHRGKRAEACRLLAPVVGWFTEGHDTPDFREACVLLQELR